VFPVALSQETGASIINFFSTTYPLKSTIYEKLSASNPYFSYTVGVERRYPVQIEIKIDKNCIEPKIVIMAQSMTEDVKRIVELLSAETPQLLAGFRNDQLEILDPAKVLRLYAQQGKVIAVTESGEYTLRQRLYELEEKLEKDGFIRISNSEIINLKKAKNFDLSLAGSICVRLSDGTITYVSRRYVSKIKQLLGI
jgi:DNA-binding LytR/AlgR family response regulator